MVKIEITAAAKRMLTEQEKRQVRETDMLAFERRYGKGVIDILLLGCQKQILLTIKGAIPRPNATSVLILITTID